MSALLIATLLAVAQEEPKEETRFFDDVGLLARIQAHGVLGYEDATRYLEYRDFIQGGELSQFEMWLKQREDSEFFFRGAVTDAGQRDQRIRMEWGVPGTYEMSILWDRIPHRFGFDGRTLYAGEGGSRLLISDAIQANLQASTSAIDAASRLNNFNTGARRLDDIDDVMFQRDQVRMDFAWNEWDPLRIDVTFNTDLRDGVRPTFGSFGFGNTVQLLRPVDYWTWGTGITLSYAEDDFDVAAGYDYSAFENNEDTLLWDNPFRNVDSTTATAYTATFAAGPRTGRMALESDNTMHRVSVRGGANLWDGGRLTGEASWTWRTSEVELLPYTTNTAIVPGAANAPPFAAASIASLPESTFDGAAATQFYQLALNTRIIESLDARFFGRYRSYDDQREIFAYPGYVRTDAVWEPEVEAERFDLQRITGGTVWTWRIDELQSRVKPGYQFEVVDRQNRQVNAVEEQTASIGIDTDWIPEVTTDLSYARRWRDGGRYTTIHEAELTLLRMFDQSNRIRDEYGAGIRVIPGDVFETGLRYRRVDEDYDADFGLVSTELNGVEMDFTVNPVESFTSTVSFGYDFTRSSQAERQWILGGLGDPAREPGFSFSNVFNDVHTDIYSAQLHAAFEPADCDFSFNLGYTYAWNRSSIDIDSPIGVAATDNNAFAPQDMTDAEDSDRHSAYLEFGYKVAPEAKLFWGYGVEIFQSDNFYNSGIRPVPITPARAYAGAYLLGLTYEDYAIHTFYFGVTLEF